MKSAALVRLLCVGAVATIAAGYGAAALAGTNTHVRTGTSTDPATGNHILAGSSSTTLHGTPAPLLTVPHFGVLTARCTPGGRLSSRFAVASDTPTPASIVVTTRPGDAARGNGAQAALSAPRGPAGPTQQTWQVTAFSEADFEVATIWVTAQPAPAAYGGSGCVAGAQATVSVIPR